MLVDSNFGPIIYKDEDIYITDTYINIGNDGTNDYLDDLLNLIDLRIETLNDHLDGDPGKHDVSEIDDAVSKLDFNENTILSANVDNTPIALTIDEQTLVGRLTSGNIDALTPVQVRSLLEIGNIFKQSDYGDSLQATINAASDGDIILLNDGTTDIGDNIITLNKRLTFVGHGTGQEGTTITSSHYNSTDPIFQLGSGSTGLDPEKRLRFIGITFSGKGSVGCGFRFTTDINHISFIDVEMIDFVWYGVFIESASTAVDWIIDKCNFYGCLSHLKCAGIWKELKIYNSLFDSANSTAMYLSTGYVQDLLIRDCAITNNGNLGIYFYDGCNNLKIQNTLISRNGWGTEGEATGIKVSAHAGGPVYNIHILGCIFDRNGVGQSTFDDSHSGTGLILKASGVGAYVSDVLVEDCKFIRNKHAGIRGYAKSSGVMTDNLEVKNCEFINNSYGIHTLYAASPAATITAQNNFWGSDDGPGDQGPGSGDKVTSGVTYSNHLQSKLDFVPQITNNYYVDGSRTDTYEPDGSELKPFKSISDVMTAIGTPADDADAMRKITVNIIAGQYDENVSIPQQRMITLMCHGTVVLGDGDADTSYNSTTPRTLTVQNTATGKPSGAPSRPMFAIKGISSEVSSTHSAYGAGNIIISGDLAFNHIDGNTNDHESYLCGVKVQGNVTANANELGSAHNMIIEKCFFDNTFNLGNANINICRSTEFDGLITVTGFGRIEECEIDGGIAGEMVDNYPPNGFFNCDVGSGTWTITNVLIDYVTRQQIIDNSITITGGYTLLNDIYGDDIVDLSSDNISIPYTYINIGNDGTGDTLTDILDLIDLGLEKPSINWDSRYTPGTNEWRSVIYGNGLFVAVSRTGTGNRVMTSPDGVNWTLRTSSANNNWSSLTYGNGLFVAVADTGTGNRIMTSSNGVNWTSRSNPEDNSWNGVCYGDDIFVAVSSDGTNRVMTSPDGVTWTASAASIDESWNDVCYGNSLFVAIASDSTNGVMTSPDGVTWTTRDSIDSSWKSVCYGNGLFVAVSTDGFVMTSPDGITWTLRDPSEYNSWESICYGEGIFVVVSSDGTNRIMTSSNGIDWVQRDNPVDNTWSSVTYGNGMFVAVSYSGTNDKAMTSGVTKYTPNHSNNIYHGGMIVMGPLAPIYMTGEGMGIGESAPGEPLHVRYDQDGNKAIRMQNESDGTSAVARYIVDVNAGSAFLAAYGSNFTTSGSKRAASASLITNATLSGGLSLVARHATSGHIRFYTGGNADANERVIITYDGKLGVKTSAPDKDFELNGNIRLSYNAPAGSATDYSDLTIGANGDLTITTVDSDGALGHINLNPDGNVKINAITQIGDGGTTNFAQFASDGELTLNGTAKVKKPCWVPANAIQAPQSRPATLVDHGISIAWQFSDEAVQGNTKQIRANIGLPSDLDVTVAPELKIGWSSATTDSDCYWQVEYLYRALDEDTTAAAQQTLTSAETSSSTANGIVVSIFTLQTPGASDVCLHIRITRRSDDASDTIDGDTVELQGVCLYYTSNKLGEAT